MTAPLPDNVDIVRVRGYWFDQDGGGNQQTVTFEPLISNITDAAAFSYIKTETVTVTPDSDTAYFFHDLIASNDPDLTPFAWKVTLQGQPSFTIAVDYNASVVDVGGGVHMKAVWLVDAATTDPPPDPISAYYTSDQTNAAIAEALDGFEVTSAVVSVAGRTGDVVLVEGDISGLVADLAAKVAKSILTTKGDLFVASASATPARLGVGSNNQILTADSTQTTGVKWADLTAGGGSVTSVTAGDGTVTIGGTGTDPTVAVNAIAESKVTNLVSDLAGKQPIDSDLTAIAALAPADGTFIKRASSAWTASTLAKADVGLGNVDNTSDATQNSATATLTNKTLTSPVINTPTGIVKGDVGLGNCDNVADASKPVSSAQLTALNGKVALSTFTTKGDIVGASASATVARLGVGSNNQVLTADSSTTTGMKWASAAAGTVSSVSNVDGTLTVTGTSTDPVVSISAAVIANVAPLGSPTFSGTATFAKMVSTPVPLTDAATIVVDASLGNLFRVTLGGNRTMGVPSTPSDGQEILFEIIQDGTGSRTVTWASSTGGYAFDVPTPILNTTAGARDFLQFVYNTAANKWRFASAPSGLTDLTAADATIVIAGTDTIPTVAVGVIAESQVTNLTTDLAAKVPLATATTKGDLLAATASATIAPLAVGTNGKVLTADSAQTTGLSWTTPTVGTVTGVTAANSTVTVAGTSAAPTIAVNAIAESQVTNLITDLAAKQPLDSDLTAIAALTATTDNFMVANASAWASRTPAQAKVSLAIVESDVTNLVSDLAAKQPLDSDLTAIAALTPGAGNVIAADGSGWVSKSYSGLKTSLAITESDVTNLVSDLAGKQPLDSDLTTIAALTATTDNFMVAAGSAWASRTPAQAKTSLAITEADVSGLVADLAGKVSAANSTLTGVTTFADAVVCTPFALTDGATINTDASQGAIFRVTLAGNRTMAVPTNPVDGQEITYELLQDATGGRTITWATGTGGFAFDTLSAPTLTLTPSKRDFVSFIYNSTATRWQYCAPPTSGWADRVETLTDGTSVSPNANNGFTQAGIWVCATATPTLFAPANGSQGQIYRAIINASGAIRVITLSGFVASTDDPTSSVTIASGKWMSLLFEYISAVGWLYEGKKGN